MISFSFSDSDEDWMKIQVKYAIISLLVLQISHLHYSIYVSLKTPTKKGSFTHLDLQKSN